MVTIFVKNGHIVDKKGDAGFVKYPQLSVEEIVYDLFFAVEKSLIAPIFLILLCVDIFDQSPGLSLHNITTRDHLSGNSREAPLHKK